MSRKKTMWFELAEDEQVEACLNRMKSEGYAVTGKKEEPLLSRTDNVAISNTGSATPAVSKSRFTLSLENGSRFAMLFNAP